MFEKIKELIVESLGIEEDQVTMEASFKEDVVNTLTRQNAR